MALCIAAPSMHCAESPGKRACGACTGGPPPSCTIPDQTTVHPLASGPSRQQKKVQIGSGVCWSATTHKWHSVVLQPAVQAVTLLVLPGPQMLHGQVINRPCHWCGSWHPVLSNPSHVVGLTACCAGATQWPGADHAGGLPRGDPVPRCTEYLKVRLAARGGGRSPDQLTAGVSAPPARCQSHRKHLRRCLDTLARKPPRECSSSACSMVQAVPTCASLWCGYHFCSPVASIVVFMLHQHWTGTTRHDRAGCRHATAALSC